MEEETVELSFETKKEVKSPFNSFIQCFVVSILSLGYGFGVTSSMLVSNWFCSGHIRLSVNNTTLNTSGTTQMEGEFCAGNVLEATYNVSIFCGAFILSLLQNKLPFSRKFKLTVSSLAYFVGFILNFRYAEALFFAIIGRFLVGSAVGISCALMIPFIEDNSPNKYKSFFKIWTPLFTTVGILINALIVLLVQSDSYYYVFVVYSCMYLLIALYIIFFLNDVGGKSTSKINRNFSSFFKKDHISLIIIILLNISQQVSLVNGVLMFYASIIKNSKSIIVNTSEELSSVILTSINLLSNILATFLVVKYEKPVRIFIVSEILVAITLICLGLEFEAAIFSYLFLFFFSLGMGPLIWSICVKILDKENLEVGIATGNIINYIFCIFSTFIFGTLMGSQYRNIFFFVASFLLLISAWLLYYFNMIKEKSQSINLY